MESEEQTQVTRLRRRRTISKDRDAGESVGRLMRMLTERRARGDIGRMELAGSAAGLTPGQTAIGLALETHERVEMLVALHEQFATSTESTLGGLCDELAAVREQVTSLDADAGERLKLIEDALAALIEEGQEQRLTAEHVRRLTALLAPESGE